MRSSIQFLLTLLAVVALALLLRYIEQETGQFIVRLVALAGIWIVASASLNLVNGTLGILSLGHSGFMLLGGYVVTILMTPHVAKLRVIQAPIGLGLVSPWVLDVNLNWLTTNQHLQFIICLALGGVVAAAVGFLVGAPAFRLRGDYLAIVTFAFGEIIRIVLEALSRISNGPLGYSGIPTLAKGLWWTWGTAGITIFVIAQLCKSSFGRALKAIREDETAAESMGINLFRHKILALVISAFFAGVAGGLYASWLAAITPGTYTFSLTFLFLVAIGFGGLGSITGAVLGALVITFLPELLRSLEGQQVIFGQTVQIFGLRQVILSLILVLTMIFYRRGLMGYSEFHWEWFTSRQFKALFLGRRAQVLRSEELAQDAWLRRSEQAPEPKQEA
ncbi:MAG: branched-chain amino acid ABC transporter permease [Deinococcus sp.]|nr:branched-chain amino acid ABC transporter permease [Deinococcus sp.]